MRHTSIALRYINIYNYQQRQCNGTRLVVVCVKFEIINRKYKKRITTMVRIQSIFYIAYRMHSIPQDIFEAMCVLRSQKLVCFWS